MSPLVKAYLAQWDSLMVKESVLYRLWENANGREIKEKLVVPFALQIELIKQLHSTDYGGHLGVTKTLRKVKDRFYWVGCRENVEDYCRTCDVCNSRKGPSTRNQARMQQFNVGSPFERVAVDILGPLPVTERGNKFLIVLMDYFTKWPEVMPVPNQEAETIAEVLVDHVFSRFGVPMELHSDQGRNFESEVFRETMKIMGINKTRTTPLHPQSDGMVERFNRTLLDYLSKFVNEDQKNWDQKIQLGLLAYRTAVHETTQYTPAKMMMGRELRLPLDLVLGGSPNVNSHISSGWVSNLQRNLREVHELARNQIQLTSDRMKARYDFRANCPKYKEGDKVWLYNPHRRRGRSPKLQRNWEGPYEVKKCLNDVVYRIQRGQGRPKVVHSDRLWYYSKHDEDVDN